MDQRFNLKFAPIVVQKTRFKVKLTSYDIYLNSIVDFLPNFTNL